MGKNIMVVDDNSNMVNLIIETLEELEYYGVELLTAENGEEALEVIKTKKPELVILDIVMPVMDGFEVCDIIKNKLGMKDTYIMMLTVDGQEYNKQKGKDVGADVFMTKPFDPDEIIKVVSEVLGIIWNDKYSVNISLIDEQHKKLFEYINKAKRAERFSNNQIKVLEILGQMAEYALKHFETEEHYMKEFNFTGYKSHRNEHVYFTNTVNEHKNRTVDGGCQITSETLEYLVHWYFNHIQVADKEYIDFFKENGLK